MNHLGNSMTPAVYFKSKRKELGLTQDEFASLFGMTKDNYRKYEEDRRTPRDNTFRLMQIIILYYEKEFSSISPNSVIDFLETVQKEEVTKLFSEEIQDVVNMTIDYLKRKAEKELK